MLSNLIKYCKKIIDDAYANNLFIKDGRPYLTDLAAERVAVAEYVVDELSKLNSLRDALVYCGVTNYYGNDLCGLYVSTGENVEEVKQMLSTDNEQDPNYNIAWGGSYLGGRPVKTVKLIVKHYIEVTPEVTKYVDEQVIYTLIINRFINKFSEDENFRIAITSIDYCLHDFVKRVINKNILDLTRD